VKALCEVAVEAALAAGASYSDARAMFRWRHVVTKNGQVDDLSDSESEGIGVRVLVDGAWGFADGATRWPGS
jgi:TldD protein